MSQTIRLIGPTQRAFAHQCIDGAPDGYVVRIGEETRSLAQNRMMWEIISDLRQQVPDMAVFTQDQVKLRFLDALGEEMVFLPKLSGAGMFPVGMRSSTLTKAQFSGLIELMFAYGAEQHVRWSRKALDAYSEATT